MMGGDAPRLAAVMVTFNRLAILRHSLPRLLAGPVDLVVVVDNASDDGTADWLAGKSEPRLVHLRQGENRGGAAGFAAGLRWLGSRDGGPDWVLLSDDDSWPEPGVLADFLDRARALPEDIGAVAAAVRLPDGCIAPMNRPGFNPFWRPGRLQSLLRGDPVSAVTLEDAGCSDRKGLPREVDKATFVGFFLSRRGLEAAGLPDGACVLYGDDVIYSLTLRRAGLRILFDPALGFVHDCRTLGPGRLYRPLWKGYYHCRNAVAIARLAAGPWLAPVALSLIVLDWLIRGLHCQRGERRLYLRLMLRGLSDGLRGRSGIDPEARRYGGPG